MSENSKPRWTLSKESKAVKLMPEEGRHIALITLLLFSQANCHALASELARDLPWTLVILAKIELSIELSLSIKVELDKEQTWEGGGIMSKSVNGCFLSLANKIEGWLGGRLLNLNDLLS